MDRPQQTTTPAAQEGAHSGSAANEPTRIWKLLALSVVALLDQVVKLEPHTATTPTFPNLSTVSQLTANQGMVSQVMDLTMVNSKNFQNRWKLRSRKSWRKILHYRLPPSDCTTTLPTSQ